jgi:hypothetical protein
MRLLLSFLLAAAVAGCGDDSTSTTAGDLAAVADLAVPADLSTLSCASVLACIAGCGQNLVCHGSCRDQGSTMAKSGYDAFAGCVAATCAPGDGSVGSCTSATDMSAKCLTCLSNAAAAALNAGNICHTAYAACAGS